MSSFPHIRVFILYTIFLTPTSQMISLTMPPECSVVNFSVFWNNSGSTPAAPSLTAPCQASGIQTPSKSHGSGRICPPSPVLFQDTSSIPVRWLSALPASSLQDLPVHSCGQSAHQNRADGCTLPVTEILLYHLVRPFGTVRGRHHTCRTWFSQKYTVSFSVIPARIPADIFSPKGTEASAESARFFDV